LVLISSNGRALVSFWATRPRTSRPLWAEWTKP